MGYRRCGCGADLASERNGVSPAHFRATYTPELTSASPKVKCSTSAVLELFGGNDGRGRTYVANLPPLPSLPVAACLAQEAHLGCCIRESRPEAPRRATLCSNVLQKGRVQ